MHYLTNEVSPAQRTLIQAHLDQCLDCQKELESISALQSRIGLFMQRRAAQSNPSLQAWSQIQTKLTREARAKPESIIYWKNLFSQIVFKGGALMRKPVYVIAIVLALIIGVTAGVPSIRAEAQDLFQQVFFRHPSGAEIVGYTVDWEAFNPTYMPAGWDVANICFGGGDVDWVGILYTDHGSLDTASGFAAFMQREAPDALSLPPGEERTVNGLPASLRTGEAVSLDDNPSAEHWLTGGDWVYRAPADGTTEPQGPYKVVKPPSAQVPYVKELVRDPYVKELKAPFVKQLTWFQGNTQLDIISDLPEAEILQIAESMTPATP
jgi:hypothetical protein